MGHHFGDQLVQAIQRKSAPACVGLDPLLERLPAGLLKEAGLSPVSEGDGASAPSAPAAEVLLRFGREVVDVIAPYVPAVKINIAFFERYFADGVRAYFELVRFAREAGLLVIGDVKRADIGHTSTQYAHAHLGGAASTGLAMPDAITINPYFGFDSVRPFIEAARGTGQGLFVLVQTSNDSAAEIQGLLLSDGSSVCERVAGLVQTWSCDEGLVGTSGYSSVGAVVSPRDIESTKRIRALMPNCLFLVPGFGAQGRTADEVARCFKPDGTGAIVNASRSVICAFGQDRYREAFGDNWRACIEQACKDLVASLRDVLPAFGPGEHS